MTTTEKYYRCEECNHIMLEEDVEVYRDPYCEDGTVNVCPNCNTTEMLAVLSEDEAKEYRRKMNVLPSWNKYIVG